MPVMLERWNDDKMDALDAKVDGLGDRMRELRQEMREERQEMREQRQELRESQKATKAGFEVVHRTIIQTTVAVLTAFIVGFAALIGLVATQL